MCTDEGIISDSSTCSKMQIGRLTFKKKFSADFNVPTKL